MQQAELPSELRQLWNEVARGKRRLDFKKVLDQIPLFTGLPHKAGENNHGRDANRFLDRQAKGWQQRGLHVLRTTAFVHSLNTKEQTKQQAAELLPLLFQMVEELVLQIENFRKDSSIPISSKNGYRRSKMFNIAFFIK